MAYSDDDLSRIFDRTDGCCHICGKKLCFGNYAAFGTKGCWEVEHHRARANGGTNGLRNLYAACISCNRRKRDGSTRNARGFHGRNAAPLSAKRKAAVREDNALTAAVIGGGAALAVGIAGPLAWAAAAVAAVIGHSAEPDKQKGKRRR
jgi:hypothetical protein